MTKRFICITLCLLGFILSSFLNPARGQDASIPIPFITASQPNAATCRNCHMIQYENWKQTKHADFEAMKKVPDAALHQCGACHDNLSEHRDEPGKTTPSSFKTMDKTTQNTVCGKCHYSKDILAGCAINPEHSHGPIMSVGFEGKKKQLSCLDCHQVHGGKTDMLQGIRAHTCFKCHKEAIVTMGVFQPINYLSAGKACLTCHASHGTSTAGHATRMTVGMAVTCGVCHIP
jgi:hypothetical protein